ncbi:MAG TPA: hypothetical protein VFS37_13495 [Conexibacter sp.]|nr:hypothetical protein [Conexibacter sp.]
MLFDLQSRNRRTFVKIIYLGLAILMGGGLVLFGIGTGTGGGGLLDAFSDNGSSTSAQISTAERRANRAIRLHPQDPQAWADLARARYQTAGLGDNYDQTANQGAGAFTAQGRAKLRTAAAAWQRYLTLEPDNPDVTLARLMANVYDQTGLDDPAQAANAMEIVTEGQPSAAAYSALAQYAYLAGQERKGDLAAARAVQLAPDAQRKLVRTQLAAFKTQVQTAAGGGGASRSAAPQTKRRGDTQGVG